jgi:superfamily II DNA or RNA helicase
MIDPTGIERISDEVLADLYDPGSLTRGRTYALEGRVTLVNARAGHVSSIVAGSGHQTYLVRVEWEFRGPAIAIGDDCSCPLGGECKHVIATILTARATRATSVSGPDWRRALEGILDLDHGDPAVVPLALQVEVTVPKPSRYVPHTDPKVLLRPMRMGKRGRWIRTGVSWRDLTGYLGHAQRDLNPAQVAVLKAMSASFHAGSYYIDTGPISLTSFGPDLWHHLDRAAATGIPLVDANGSSESILVSDIPARATLDLTSDADGSVTVSAAVTLDGEPIDLARGHSGLIGEPPHGVFHTGPDGVLHLSPLDRSIPRALARMLEGSSLVVPPGDVDELLDTYQPQLALVAEVRSSDNSVSIVPTEFDGLTLFVQRTGVAAIDLEWTARYRRGEHLTHHALRSAKGRSRDRAAERAAVAALDLPVDVVPQLASPAGEPEDAVLRGEPAIRMLTQVVPALVEGGRVHVDVFNVAGEELPELREATQDPLISLTVTDRAGSDGQTDWFDLAVEVSVDGEDIPFAALFTALNDAHEVYVLPSGTWLRLDRPEFARLRELIDEARGLADADGADGVRVNRFQAAWWDELADLGVVRSQSSRWSDSVARMRDLAAPEPVEPPRGLQAKLRRYQQEGFDWLAFLHRNGLGGILADDMGLGKTIQTLALCLHVAEQQPEARFLVVAPTSVVENWRHEAAQFAPDLTVRTIHETATRRGTDLSDEIAGASLVVTSYALFRIEFDQYAAQQWELLLLDEAQFVKNHQGKTYQCVRRLDATMKLAITGTPLENSLMDLWSLLSITAPGLYPDPQRFSQVYRKPIERGEAPELLDTLRRRIAPLMRRRTKEAVLTELPPKTEQTIEIELGARHARIYQTQLQRQRQKVLGLVGDVQRHRFEIFKSLTLLRQLSLDPALVDEAHETVGSAKLDRLVDDLQQILAEGHRALVFSQFTRYLARVRTRLDAAGIEHAYLDGRTRNRAKAIGSFKDGDVPVFVISLKAGGVGLNLTEADYCFVLDPWWNPAVETQAIDRTHRIGQVNPVVVYRYVSTGTIEEKVMELKARKAALFSDVLDADGALAGALSEADIRGLLDLS